MVIIKITTTTAAITKTKIYTTATNQNNNEK